MSHVDFDTLYHLAECVEEEHPFSDVETMAMKHIAECKQCYGQFCALVAIMSVTSDSGYVVLSELLSKKNAVSKVEQVSNRIMAVVSIAINRVRESASVIMGQVEQLKNGLVFEPALAVAARDVSGNKGTSIEKLEDIENEKNYITVDPISRILLVQIDGKDFDGANLRIYIQLKDGNTIEIPLSKVGTVYRGKVEKLPEEEFELVIMK